MHPIKTALFFLLCAISLIACRKYMEGPATVSGNPAYLRVFNVVPYTLTPFNSTAPAPFFTFLFDPLTDKSGVPSGARIIGDWLGPRQLYAISYSINEGNSLNASLDTLVKYNINYEYPGAAHVLTAPPLNGFDLSAWAQVPSGKHRIQFVVRPQTDTPFVNLPTGVRKAVLIDTTIDLDAGEVYTLEAVSTDEDNNKYAAYLRKEQFVHQAFSDSNMYLGLFNLSGKRSQYDNNIYAPSYGDFPDTMRVSYTYNIFDDIFYRASNQTRYAYFPLPSFDRRYLTTITARLATTTDYQPLPLLPLHYFFDDQGILRTYYGLSATSFTTMPWVSLYFKNQDYDAGSGSPDPEIDCNLDPALLNNYRLFYNTAAGVGNTANLDLLSNSNGVVTVHPCLNILEIVYKKIYMLRIQPAFYNHSN